MEEAITLMGRSESIFRMSSNLMHQLPPEPSHQEAFEDLVMNFILDQEERVKQLEEYMGVIWSDFMQLTLKVVEKLKEEIRIKKNKFTKIKKITRYPDTKDLEPLNGDRFLKALTEKASFHTSKFVSPKSLYVKHVRTIFPSPPLVKEITFGFKPGAKNNQNVKPRHDAKNESPQSSPQVLPSFEEYTPPVTCPKEVEETVRIPMDVEPLEHMKLEYLGLNTCSHDLFLSSMEIPSVYESEPQILLNFSPLDVNIGDKRGTDPPIKSHNPDIFRMKSLLSGGDNKPPMLEKHLYDSWKSRMELYMMNRPHGRMILVSVEKGLPTEIYALVSQHRVAKDIWEKIRLLMQGMSLIKQERECKLYDEFDKFTYKKGESLHEYYLRFTLLLNDMNIYKMPLEQFHVNAKFLNTLHSEWSKFVTDVKLVKDLHTTNVDQIHVHLEQHERHANEVRLMHERSSDPLALVASHQMTQSPYQSHQRSYQNSQHQQFVSPHQSSQYGSPFESQ
ncbi:hypothetical protein Tco_1240257 [Tanacetum coccineum]